MKEWRRVLSCFLAVLLTVYLVPVQVMAEELGDLWPPTTENVVDAPAEVVGEILEQREENRKEFLLTDGTRQVVIYPAAVHYQKDGYWEEIDNRLLPSAAQDGETVYQDVYHDTDVTYDLDSNRLKESLILRSCPKELLGYRYYLEAENLRLELQEDNRILAYAKDADSEAKPVFYMPASYLLDAENVCSDDIKVILEENEKGYELRYYLPQDWMADASYPVVLDPVVFNLCPIRSPFGIKL